MKVLDFSELASPAASIQFPKRLGDPFDSYFKTNGKWKLPAGGLLDIAGAERWLEVVGWGSQNDLYTYQQAFEKKSGPRVQLGGQEFLMLSSYDYLGCIATPITFAAISRRSVTIRAIPVLRSYPSSPATTKRPIAWQENYSAWALSLQPSSNQSFMPNG